MDDPGGTPASRKTTLLNLRKGLVAGSDTQVQFNDGGVFGGDAGLTYNKTTDTLTSSNIVASTLNAPIPESNFLINGSFNFAQRTTPTTSTTIADQGYSADRWRCYRQTADLQFRRYAKGDSGSDFTNLTARAYARYTKITNSTKFLVCQPIESVNTFPLVGRSVIFQVQLRADSSRTFKIGLVEWAGTANTLTAAMVSAWNADNSDPSFASSYSLLASSSCSVTTAFQTFSVSATVSSSCNNLIPIIFSDAGVTATTGYLEIAEAGLYDGAVTRGWLPPLIAIEKALCERYFEKTYDADTVPGSNTRAGAYLLQTVSAGTAYFTFPFVFRSSKRSAPTMTAYDPVGNSGKGRYWNGGSSTDNSTFSWAAVIGTNGIYGYTDNVTTKDGAEVHWTAAAEL